MLANSTAWFSGFSFKEFAMSNNKPVIQRFWDKVKKESENECWEWIGAINSTGRGIFNYPGMKNGKAHRVSWIIHYGDIPNNLCVLHHCDNGKCVNPNHLFLGTKGDNNTDRKQKGRSNPLRGENDPKSKLTEENVRDIRKLYIPDSKEFNQFKLADMFGVSRSTILAILRGDNWKHVK